MEPYAAGDVSFHFGWTLHRAGPNTTSEPRKVHTVIYMDRDMRLAEPKNVSASDISFGSQHVGGGNFLFVDGGVRFMSDSVDSVVYQALGTRSGAESVTSDW